MEQGILYTKSHYRRPVYRGRYPDPDVQGRVPRAWCPGCGREVFTGYWCGRCRSAIPRLPFRGASKASL